MVTTPDRAKGRGLQIQSNPVKRRSEEVKILTLCPNSLKDPELEKQVGSLKPDLFVVTSYGKLIPSSWLRIPRIAPWNIHPSLLPKYRGAAPIAWQILEGEQETGVSIARVTPELDAGDILHQIQIPLAPNETADSLSKRLAELARKALEETFVKLKNGTLKPIAQKHAESNYARKLTKEDGYLDLAEPAIQLERKVRAFYPWPGAFIECQGKPLRILESAVDSTPGREAEPGKLLEVSAQGYLRLQTGKGSLKISKVQKPGRNPISAYDFANGMRIKAGFIFKSLRG